MISYYLRLIKYISQERRRQIYFLLIFLFMASIVEVLPLFIVGPFINNAFGNGLIDNPNLLDTFFSENSKMVNFLYFSLVLIVSSLIKTFSIYIYSDMISLVGQDLSLQLYSKIINQPYYKIINNNSSKLISAITQDLTRVIGKSFGFLEFLSSSVTIILLIISLLIINFKINFLILIFNAISYFLITTYTKKRLYNNGKIISKNNFNQVKEIREGLGSLRDIIIYNKFDYFENNFKLVDIPLKKAKANNNFLLISPKYFLEPIAIIILLGITILFITNTEQLNILPLLGTLLYGLQKITFAAQKVYRELSGFVSCKASFNVIFDLLSLPLNKKFYKKNNNEKLFFNSIKLENIAFDFNNKIEDKIFYNLNLEIKRGEKIRLVGPSGSGKTTLINIIIGIYFPQKGRILLNNKNLYNYLNEWREIISYVPQDPYLLDKTLVENIAFGETLKEINFEKIKEIIKLSYLEDFVNMNEKGYFTNIGDKGLKISGGQKQRIAIARALYKNKQFIILDEPTSAIDKSTESLLFKTFSKLDKDITVILVSHDDSLDLGYRKIYLNKINNL